MPSLKIPNDADGDAMRRVIAGADLTRPMKIDFQIDCPDIASAREVAARVPRSEFANARSRQSGLILLSLDVTADRKVELNE